MTQKTSNNLDSGSKQQAVSRRKNPPFIFSTTTIFHYDLHSIAESPVGKPTGLSVVRMQIVQSKETNPKSFKVIFALFSSRKSCTLIIVI